MTESQPNTQNTPTGKTPTLICTDCEQVWSKCQCSTRRVDLSDSVIAKASGLRKPGSSDGKLDIVVDSKYEILDVIGKGGMGEVYLAEHVVLKKKFALKVLKKTLLDSEVVVERLRREAKACALLTHPNLVDVLDFGITDNGFPYIAMKFIEGTSLNEFEDLEPSHIAKIMLDVCRGLAFAHSKGVIHRDLKPANILVSNPNTEVESAIVVDFGIAKAELPGGEIQHLTQTGEVLGSPAYMSPEQIQGKPIDARSDIYSIGCILYELLTGKQLFRGHNMFAVIEENLNNDAPVIKFEGKYAKQKIELEKIMRKCLEKDRDKRYQSMDEVNSGLKSFLDKYQGKSKLKPTLTPLLSGLVVIALCTSYYFYNSNKSNTLPKAEKDKIGTYQELFDGSLYRLNEYEKKSENYYKTMFDDKESVDIRLGAAAEYISAKKNGLSYISKSKKDIELRKIIEVCDQAEKLIRQSKKNNTAFDTKIGSSIYFLHSAILGTVVEKKVEKLVPDQDDFATSAMVIRHAVKNNFEIKRYYQDSANLLKKAIILVEEKKGNNLQRALYYGYLGEKLRALGQRTESIRASAKALKLLQEEDETLVASHLIWWHYDIGQTYLVYHDMRKAMMHHDIARQLLQKYPDASSSGYVLQFTKDINEIQKRKKNLTINEPDKDATQAS